MGRCLAAVLLVAVILLGGCGGSADRDTAGKALTIPSDGRFAATRVPIAPGNESFCRRKADSFSRAARSFLIPYPSDADVYRVLARVHFTAFQAHRCDVALLREALARRLTTKQLHEVLAFFGFMGDVGRELAHAPRR